MPQTIGELLGILDVVELQTDLYLGVQPNQPQLARVFGGQVLGQALQAATKTVDSDRSVHSMHVNFILGGDPHAPIQYAVTRLRDGRSFTTRRVVALQHGREICQVTASYQVDESGYEHGITLRHLGDPESFPSIPEVLRVQGGVDADFWANEWKMVDMRVDPECFEIDGISGQRMWLKIKGAIDGPQSLHRSILSYLSDLTFMAAALVPHGFFIGSPAVQRASLDHALWFHDDVDVSQWMVYDQFSPWAGGGRGLARAGMFDSTGRIIASVAQEGLMRPRLRGEDHLTLSPSNEK
jgi:acyl-CoA thioesterase-2